MLVLYSDERLLPANVIFDRSFRATFQAGATRRTEFHSEFLDVSRFSSESQQENQRDFLRRKYLDYPPDLLVAVSGSAVAFLMKYRSSLFTESPVVYLTWQGEAPPGTLSDQKAVGISTPGDAFATLRLVLDLQPDTRRIAVITGSSQRDKVLAEEMRKVVGVFENRVVFSWLTDLSLPALRNELARLPDHTVAFYLTLFQDAAGSRFTPQEALDQFAPASRVPIYAYYDTYLGHGIIGGCFVTFEEIGRKAAEAGLRVLAGERPRDVAGSEIGEAIPMFDWRELRRWNLGERQLPRNSVVLFKQPDYWKKYRWIIFGVVSASLVEALLIAILFVQLRRRRQAEAFLRESEERMSVAAESAKLGMWAWDIRHDEIWATEKCRSLFGFKPDEPLDFQKFIDRVHPEDRNALRQAVMQSLKVGDEFDTEYRLLPDFGVCWIGARGHPSFDHRNRPVRLLGACIDVTTRKQAELQLQQQRDDLAHLSRVTIISELATTLAHELNQPLGAIHSNAETAEISLKSDPPNFEELSAILSDIRQDAWRGGEVIHRMRSLLKKQGFKREQIEIKRLIETLETLLQVAIMSHKARLRIILDPALPQICGDTVQLQQVLLNLVLNALEAMADCPIGEREVTVRATACTISTVKITISDRGAGFSSEKLANLFAPFFTTKKDGMGIGLSVCRTIVEAHGGRLTVESNPDRGATVGFTLPVNDQEGQQIRGSSSSLIRGPR